MKRRKPRVSAPFMTAVCAAACMSMLSGHSSANTAAIQDCLLEGVVQSSESSEGVKSVYVDFYSARQMSEGAHCSFADEEFEFNGILGSQISNVSAGANVKYRFTREPDQEPVWQLLQVSI